MLQDQDGVNSNKNVITNVSLQNVYKVILFYKYYQKKTHIGINIIQRVAQHNNHPRKKRCMNLL